MGLAIEYTMTIGDMLTVTCIVGGGLYALGIMKGTVNDIREEIKDMQDDIKTFAQALIQMAVQKNRLDNIDRDIRDIKRGKGFIVEREQD